MCASFWICKKTYEMKSIYEKESVVKHSLVAHYESGNPAIKAFNELCTFRQAVMEDYIEFVSEVILDQIESEIVEKNPVGTHRFEFTLHHSKEFGDVRNVLVDQWVRRGLFGSEDALLRKIKNIKLFRISKHISKLDPGQTTYTFACDIEQVFTK